VNIGGANPDSSCLRKEPAKAVQNEDRQAAFSGLRLGCTPASNAFDDTPHTLPHMQPEQQNSICIR
jgi:hypothetical protein